MKSKGMLAVKIIKIDHQHTPTTFEVAVGLLILSRRSENRLHELTLRISTKNKELLSRSNSFCDSGDRNIELPMGENLLRQIEANLVQRLSLALVDRHRKAH